MHSGVQEMMCNVFHDGDRTTYFLPGMSYDICTTTYEFSWSNRTNHVLANHLGKIQNVINNNLSTLITRDCINDIGYKAHCPSKGNLLDFMANCTTMCPPGALKGISSFEITTIAAASTFLVLAGLTGFLCYKYKIYRRLNCAQDGE